MPKSVKSHFKIYEDMIQILLLLHVFLVEDSQVEYPLCGVPSCPEISLLLCNDLFRL